MVSFIIYQIDFAIMVKSTPSTPVKKGSSPAKRSPGKSHKPVPTKAVKNRAPLLSVINFGPDFSFEIYMYEKNESNDAFTYGIVRQIRGEGPDSHALFDAANFTQVLTRRVPDSNDAAMRNAENNYDRKIFLRYPQDGISTVATRSTGLQALRSFLMDSRFSQYPPAIVDVRDLTNHEATLPLAMDKYMMNADIQSVVEHDLDEDVLDHHFRNEFPDCANVIWQSGYVGAFGLTLGF